MSAVLETYLDDYLQLRRAMGHHLLRYAELIGSFLAYMEATNEPVIAVKAAVAWASLPRNAAPTWKAHRLMVVRGFAAYVHGQDESLAQIIPLGLIPARVTRGVPYIYSPHQIRALMDAASMLQPPLRALTTTTVIGLMASTGIRISECLGLNISDLDAATNVLTITGKRGKQRFVPVDPSTTRALTDYLRASRGLAASPDAEALFLNSAGRRARPASLETAFRALASDLSYAARPGGKVPRLHDCRHYVDGWVMRPVGVLWLVGAVPVVF